MNRTLLSTALIATALLSVNGACAATFNYHGNLQDAGKPADGSYDLELTLYSAPEGGKVLAGPLVMYKVPVHDGTFSTEADFGSLAQTSGATWLAVKVRNAGNGEFAALSARAPLGADATATGCPGSWSTQGNAGNIVGSFLGTTDAQPLILQTGGQQIVRTDLLGGGTVPRWIGGGSLNGSSTGSEGGFIGGGGSSSSGTLRNQVGTFSVVAGGAQNSAGYTAATGYSAICGGDDNKANVNYATVGGGTGNTITADYATISGGALNSAGGAYAAVPGGIGNIASGIESFAAGASATAGDHSFVWSDGYGATGFASSAANQFDVKASGGMALNGSPKNNEVELSIYPGASTVYNYSSLFMGNKGDTGGMLISVGDETSATSNDATFYMDQFDGTNQSRKFSVSTNGITVNAPTEIPATVSTGLVALNLVHSPGANVATLDMFPASSSSGYYELSAATSDFRIARYVPNTSYTPVLDIAGNGDLTVTAAAFKPGGGVWSTASDRRIKQDIAPIHDALDTVMKLRPVNFHYTPEYRAMEGGLPDKSYAGFIAQEFADVFPEAVVSTGKKVPGAAEGDPSILALDSNPALITTVAAVQELAVENSELHKQIDALEARLNTLEGKRGE